MIAVRSPRPNMQGEVDLGEGGFLYDDLILLFSLLLFSALGPSDGSMLSAYPP